MKFKEGDFVTRRSYDSDIIFKIEKIYSQKAILRGCRLRLLVEVPLNDLLKMDSQPEEMEKTLFREANQYLKRRQRNIILNNFRGNNNNPGSKIIRKKPGSVLHIDGDKNYLKMSLQNYSNLQIPAVGFHVPEKEQPAIIRQYLESYHPDILVITGHDGLIDKGKHNVSEHFIRTVKNSRKVNSSLDELIIFAGACFSPCKKLLEEGANFASSPQNQLLHFLDPVLIVDKIAYTSIKEVVSIEDILKITITEEGVGGLETRGKMRLCYP